MAKRMKKGMRPIIRGYIREGIRSGKGRLEIAEGLEDKFGQKPTRVVMDMIREEERRQGAVATVMGANLRSRINLGRAVGCTDDKSQIRAYISIRWYSEEQGRWYNKGLSTILDKEGRMMDILNKALRAVRDFDTGRGSDPPVITSSMRSGKASYRVEYVECV